MAITEDFIDFDNEQVLVIGSKGRPPRLVPLNATVTKVLQAMIEDSQLPFPVKDFRKRWYTALRNAGINKKGGTREENYHFHDLRSYFASELIKRNTNPLIVQNLFAHSDMSITTVYAQTDDKLLLEAVKRLDDVADRTEPGRYLLIFVLLFAIVGNVPLPFPRSKCVTDDLF